MLILIGRGLDLKEELEHEAERRAKRKRGKRKKRRVIARKFEVNFHCAVFRVWKSEAETKKRKLSKNHNRIKNFR